MRNSHFLEFVHNTATPEKTPQKLQAFFRCLFKNHRVWHTGSFSVGFTVSIFKAVDGVCIATAAPTREINNAPRFPGVSF